MATDNPRTIRLDAADNVIVAHETIAEGAEIASENLTTLDAIPSGHKVATAAIAKGEAVRKFNQTIGFATTDIEVGRHVQTNNCAFAEFERDYAYGEEASATVFLPEKDTATFMGYRRANSDIGTRNYIGILTSVNCSATVARHIAEDVNRSGILDDYPNVDGVVAFVHGTGCCLDANDEGFANLQRTLWGYARHANFAGVLMVGLGCEVNQIPLFHDLYGLKESKTFHTLIMQDTGGTRKTIAEGVKCIEATLPTADANKREPVPVGSLSVALQCGGSDGYSGITANPAMGAAVDLLARHGGTAILAETPEIYGAEHLLTRRAQTREVGEKLTERIRWWEDYTKHNNGVMDNNPTPGNKAGGLTTILEKSLRAASKGGTTNLTGVFKYAQPIDTTGFVSWTASAMTPARSPARWRRAPI
jgi:altronate hydrolase